MKLSATRETLVRADILAPKPLASGFPVWLPFGTRLAERLDALYLEELGAATEFLELEPRLLIDEATYAATTSGSFDYQNMYSMARDDGSGQLVRPDNLVTAAHSLRNQPTRVPVVMQGSLYRSETGDLHPLVRDRHIWRTTQVVHWLGGEDPAGPYEMHATVLARFLARIGIPTLYVESPPLREHSRLRLLTFACPAIEQVTLTATLYLLARPLVAGLGLSGAMLDFGFTAKLLACIAALHADDTGLICMSSLAPDVVVVGCKTAADRGLAERIAAELRPAVGRVAVDPAPWHRTVRVNRRRGTPLLVLADATQGSQLVCRIDDQSVRLATDAATMAREHLQAHDEALVRRARRVLEQALAEERAVRVGPRACAPQAQEWHSLGTLIGVDHVPPGGRRTHDSPEMFARHRRLY
jgi:hypothetical protein